MVWGLFPVDPLPGEHEYYIFSKGTYKVGRKGCDIIINKDKGVSRVHAEIIVDEMICIDQLQKRNSKNPSKVRIRDCSKYGTLINKNLGSKENVHECPNKETTLKDGDMVAFGTGNAKYRFSFVSLVLFASLSTPSKMNQLQEKASLIGAIVTQSWTSKCTHMVIDDFISINNETIDAIVAGKPLVRFSWIESIAGKTICTEIPSYVSHSPTLTLEGLHIKVCDPRSRQECLKGHNFLLDSMHKYKFKEKLQLLLDVGGANVVYVEAQDPCSQNLGDNLVCVMPAGLTSSTKNFDKFNSVPKVKEIELISAVVSGHLDPFIIASAPVLVTSSCSTDETVVADSDVEMETHTSAVIKLEDSAEDECLRKISESDFRGEKDVHIVEPSEHDGEQNTDSLKPNAPETIGILTPNQENIKSDDSISITRKDKGEVSESENLDIIYSQNLIVRESNFQQSGHWSGNGAVINFKRFRKKSDPSGNSFDNLIPFSKYPYEESEYGNEDVAASVKEEKKRKQMEAIADDLFNNVKGKKRGASGALHGVFARS